MPETAVWTNQYEVPSVQLYSLEESTAAYVPEVVEDLSPFSVYYYFDEQTQTFTVYEPTAPVWTDYFEESIQDLYVYEPSTQTFILEEEPSPLVQEYFIYSDDVQSFVTYQPEVAVWSQYYQVPSVDVYFYDVSTNTYVIESEPSPYQELFTWDVATQQVV